MAADREQTGEKKRQGAGKRAGERGTSVRGVGEVER